MLKKLFGKKKNYPAPSEYNTNAFTIGPTGPTYTTPQDTQTQSIIKVVFTGAANTGKSCLVMSQFQQQYKYTIGVQFKCQTVQVKGDSGQGLTNMWVDGIGEKQKIQGEGLGLRDGKIKVQLWDTAGVQSFKSIVSAYYKGADVIVLVYSLDDRKSFEETVSIYQDIIYKKHGKQTTKGIVIATKKDLERQVSVEEGIQFAKRVNGMQQSSMFGYYEVSCKQQPQFVAKKLCMDLVCISNDPKFPTMLQMHTAGPQQQTTTTTTNQQKTVVTTSSSQNSQNFDYLIKTCLIGHQRCGKSSIMSRYVDNQFKQEMMQTIGVDFRFKMVESNGYTSKLQLWDTSTKFSGFNFFKTVLKCAKIVFYIYDSKDPVSFQNLKDDYIPTSLSYLQDTQFTHHVIVANKAYEQQSGTLPQLIQKGRSLAEEYKWNFLQVSALKNINITELFELSLDYVIKNDKTLQKKQ